ncbi:MAG TPA: DUF4432 family protein [Chthonomonadaceae bacterium]|nr:DUF4432 family protein [Chthonomonadaceae bacterium]
MVTFMLLVTFLYAVPFSKAQPIIKGRRSLVLEGQTAQLVVDIGGGSFTNFHLRSQGLNPLEWGAVDESMAPHPMGHFLCLDRWGAPSEAEAKNGMPFHGEAAHVEWQVVQAPIERDGKVQAEMTATLPLAGLKVKRRIQLSVTDAFFIVREEVTNANKLGRLFNMVQHPTIGPPFLDEHTVVDANARRGFMQSSPLPNPEEPAVYWPEARQDGQPVNMRYLTNDANPSVVSYTIDEEYGWVAACNPSRGLLIGYLWKSAEYPWFSAWRNVEKGKPAARGLEFGTTGLHQPFSVLVAKGRIFGRSLYEYLDAGETTSKTFACFLFKIPRDYRGVDRLTYTGGRLILHERDAGPERDLGMDVGELFPSGR